MPASDSGAGGPGSVLTAAQTEVLAAQRAAPRSAAHNVGQYIELAGPLDVEALREAVRHTLAEADGLRFTVHEEGGRLHRAPGAPDDTPALPLLDTSGAHDPTAAAVELVRQQLACPPRLDLLLSPSARGRGAPRRAPALTGAVLARVGPQRHLLFQYFHHLAVDGYGVSLLNRRIAEVYTALVRAVAAPGSPFLPARVLAEAEHAYRESGRYAADRAHWAARYADGPRASGFAGGCAPPSDTALRRTLVLDVASGRAVAATARAAGVTWAEAVGAALAVQLHRDTGTEDAVLAVYAMARTAPGTLRVPGSAVNILPARFAVGGRDSFGALLERAGREFAQLRAHQLFRGEEIVRELWPGQRGPRVPGPLLNLRPFDTELDFAGVTGHVVTLASGPVDDLSVSVVRHPDGRLRIDVDANPALYDEEALSRHAVRYEDLLRRLCAEPGRPLSGFALLDGDRIAAAASRPAPPPDDRGAPPGAEEEGELPLLPSAHRLRESGAPVELLHDSVLLSVPPSLTAPVLRRALARLAREHAALRLRLHRTGGGDGDGRGEDVRTPDSRTPWAVSGGIGTEDGRTPDSRAAGTVSGGVRTPDSRTTAGSAGSAQDGRTPRGFEGTRPSGVWTTEILPSALAPAVADPETLRRVDVRGAVGGAPAELVATRARAAVRALDPDRGVVLRAVWFDAGASAPGRLLLTGHRLAVDDASWRLLVPRLAALCSDEAPRAKAPDGPEQGLRDWAAGLLAEAHGRARAEELPYWQALTAPEPPRPHTPGPSGTAPPAGPVPHTRAPGPETVTRVDCRVTGDPAAFDVPVLTALALATAGAAGPGALVELERPDGARPPHLVGALTTVRPVRLELAGCTGAAALRRVARALDEAPDDGRGHELLRRLNAQTAPSLAAAERPAVHWVRRGAAYEWTDAPGWGRAPAGEEEALRAALAAVPGAEPPPSAPLELSVRADDRTGLTLRWRWADGSIEDGDARALAAHITALVTNLVTEHGTTEHGTTEHGTTEHDTKESTP